MRPSVPPRYGRQEKSDRHAHRRTIHVHPAVRHRLLLVIKQNVTNGNGPNVPVNTSNTQIGMRANTRNVREHSLVRTTEPRTHATAEAWFDGGHGCR